MSHACCVMIMWLRLALAEAQGGGGGGDTRDCAWHRLPAEPLGALLNRQWFGGGRVQPCVAVGGQEHQDALRDRGAWKAVVENRQTWVCKVSCIRM